MSNATANVISDTDKKTLLQNLSDTKAGTLNLENLCYQNNDPTNVQNCEDRFSTLGRQHDSLSAAEWKDWIGDATAVKAGLKSANDGLNDCIKQIQQSIDTAQAIVKGLGYIDQAITIASKLLPP
jgi:hypothetical protein